MPKILVTGGAGYIGSHTVLHLLSEGFEVVSVDSHVRADERLLQGVRQVIGRDWPHYVGDLCEAGLAANIFKEHPDIEGVVHFAALKSVPESVAEPLRYYHNNVMSLYQVLQAVREADIPYFIFSSSCSVYGAEAELPVCESSPLGRAESPYAYTKQIGERLCEDLAKAWPDWRCCLLRYFNPAGAHPSGLLGEIPQAGAYNVLPILMEAHLGLRPQFQVHGSDYETRDGTCIRDYIHVMDLAAAHTQALRYLMQAPQERPALSLFNLGSGQAQTVLELIQAFSEAVGQPLPYSLGPRRAGDVPAIYADTQRAKTLLGWEAQHSLAEIMQTAWRWEQRWRGL